MKMLRWFKWFRRYTPKAEAEKLQPIHPLKTFMFPENKDVDAMPMMIRIIRARRDRLREHRDKPKWLLLSSDQHKELVKEIKKKFSAPWIKPKDFKETVEQLSRRFMGMDIICAGVDTPPSFNLSTCKKEGVLEL